MATLSRSKKVFGLVQKERSDVTLCRDMLVVLPTEHILRGFLFETTMQRDMVYLWRVVTPIYRPMRHVILDYSNRLNRGEPAFINRSDYAETAKRVSEIITDGHIEFLKGIRGPSDFLGHIARRIGNPSVLFRLDLAFTYHLVGKHPEAAEIVQALDIEVDRLPPRQREYVLPLVKEAARATRASPEALTALLQRWEDQNIETLGLQPSRL